MLCFRMRKCKYVWLTWNILDDLAELDCGRHGSGRGDTWGASPTRRCCICTVALGDVVGGQVGCSWVMSSGGDDQGFPDCLLMWVINKSYSASEGDEWKNGRESEVL